MKHASALVCIMMLAACGADSGHPPLFSTDWVDDHGKSISAVEQRVRQAPASPSADVAVAVAGNNDTIVGLPLGGGSKWTFSHALDARPIVAGTVVVGSGKGEIFALDALSGKKLWERPTGGLPLLGAGDDGQLTAVTLSRGAGSTLLVVARDGAVQRQLESDTPLGAPAVRAGIVFVPWANQYVSAIDPVSGDEVGRATLRDKVTRAMMLDGKVYFGELAFVRFDERIGAASSGGGSRVGIPTRELPGTPRLLVPGTEKLPPAANARDRDRLFARPAASSGGPLTIDSGRFYATYFRLAFGFDVDGGKLQWVHTHPVDLIGGEAIPGGLVLCDEGGGISVLDARTGTVAQEQSFGQPIKSCSIQADALRPSGASAAGEPLVQQITKALSTHEATLATAHRLLVRELGSIEDEAATKTLVDLAADPRTSPTVRADVRAALSARRNGASYMIAALGRHYDYLKDVLASPPVGPMADALAAMKETRAAPLLASHLFDPVISDDDVRRAAAALAVLATPAEKPRLEQFFAMYRGTAQTEDIAHAVGSVAEALLRVGGKDARALVEAASKDSMTVEAARGRLQALLSASAPAAAPADKPTSDAGVEASPKPSSKP